MPERNDYKSGRSGGYNGGNGGGGFGGNAFGNAAGAGGPLGALVPPHSIEAEQSTLGAMLIERAAVEKVFEILEKDDFYRDAHQTIFDVISFLTERDEPIDFITVQNELKNRDRLDSVGGIAYLTALFDTVPTAANVEYYAKIVEEKATLRRLISASLEIIGSARGEVEDVGEVLDEAERAIFSVSQQRATAYFSSLKTLLLSVYDKAAEQSETKTQISGLPTGIHDFDMITSGLQNTDLIIVAARPSMGKCLPGYILIDDPVKGARVTLEEYIQQKVPTVFGLSDSSQVRPTAISAWVDSGVKPCYRVRTCTGRTVDVTGHHPFLTVHGWTPLHDLTVGHKIAVPRCVPAFGTDDSLPRDLVRLMAYFIAEGGLTATCPHFTNTDPVIISDFHRIITQYYPTCIIRQERITYKVVRPTRSEWKSSPNPVTEWLRDLGLMGKLSEHKSFPECVWRWTRPALAEFLRVLMSCDGTIYNMGGYPRIEFAVASEKLAQDVHHALTRFGIVSKLWRKTPRCWRVEITDPNSVAVYQTEIGWIGEKAARFGNEFQKRRSNTGHLPPEAWNYVKVAVAAQSLSLVELARRSGETVKQGKYAGYNPHLQRGLPQNRLARYAEVLDDAYLRRLSSPDIYWDEIVSIEPIGEHHVYDLSVPDGANFIAQDVCVHNTSLCLSIAEHVALKEHKPVAIFSLEMSKEQLALRMLCSQAQINSHRLRTGHLNEDEWGDLANVVQRMYEAPIFIDDATETSALTMRSKCRRLMAEHGLGLIVVDYLQLMRSHRRTENRVQEIGEIARGLKSLGRELKVPVIALSQLSRAVESRENKRPMLSDLRECVTGDTRLMDAATGKLVPIRDVQTGDHILAMDSRQKVRPFEVERVWSTGVKPVFALKTRTGRSVTATANHPLLTAQGWKRLEELQVGDIIATAMPQYDFGDGVFPLDQDLLALPPEVARLLPDEAVGFELNYPARLNKTLNGGASPKQFPACAGIREEGAASSAPTRSSSPLPSGTCTSKAQGFSPGKSGRRPRRDICAKFAENLKDELLGVWANSDLLWEEIKSITPSGEEEVFDITVPGCANFLANGIVAHNSGSIEAEADMVCFLYREAYYKMKEAFNTEGAERPERQEMEETEIIVGKHRNGPTGMVKVGFMAEYAKFVDLDLTRTDEPTGF